MTAMNAMERMSAVLAGQQADHPPVSFWFHFPPACQSGSAAVDAHLEHLSRFRLDFLKIMNDNPYPTRRPIKSAADLRDLPVLLGDEDGYHHQLELIRTLAKELSGQVLLTTTLFHAWAILRRLVTPRTSEVHHPPKLGGSVTPVDQRMSELLREDRTAVAMALDTIAASQANFAKRCVEAGADGVFLSVRDDWVDNEANGKGTYDEIVRIGDGQILTAVAGAKLNMLHVCGVPQDFDAFASYPVHVINWADRAAGPAIGQVIDRMSAIACGGVDNLDTLPNGSPGAVREEVRDTLRQAGTRPVIISAGCTFDPELVSEENLHAMVDAAREGGLGAG